MNSIVDVMIAFQVNEEYHITFSMWEDKINTMYLIFVTIIIDQRVSKSLSGWQFKLGNSKLDWPKTPQPDRIRVRPWEAFLSFRYAMRG